MPDISAKKGPVLVASSRPLALNSNYCRSKDPPYFKNGGEAPFLLLAGHPSYLFAIKTRDLWSRIFVGFHV